MTSNFNLTPNQASDLLCNGAFLICLECPIGVEFGIDYKVFKTGK